MGYLKRELCLRVKMLLIAFAILSAPGLGAQSPAGGVPAKWLPFTFTAENGATTEADSATLTLPMIRASKGMSSKTVSLPLVRFRQVGKTPVPRVPIIYLSGGSGSGISASRGMRFTFFQALRQSGDVITFDLRGSGKSRPRIVCTSDKPIPVDQPLEYLGLVSLLRSNASLCADSLRQAGIDPQGFNIRETVEDIEAIRLALGADSISLVGISTGSEIGLEYIRRHGDHVAHAVLAGVQAPNQTVDIPSEQDAVLRVLSEQMSARSAASTGTPELWTTVRSVLDSLTARPALVRVRDRRSNDSVTVRLGKFDAQVIVSATLGDRKMMQSLPAIFGAAARGNYIPLASFKLEAARGGITSPFEALQDCQTGVAIDRLTARAKDARTALLGLGTLDFPEHCAGWGVQTLDRSWRTPVRSMASVLLISGTLDGRTSVANAREALKGLSNGMHLIIVGASHGDDLFLAAPSIAMTITAFLDGARPSELSVTASP